MVVRKILDEHLLEIKKSIYENQLFREMEELVIKNNLKISFNVYETKSFCQFNVYISVLVYDAFDKVYKVPETSPFYDDIGSLGGAECVFSYKKRISSIKKWELTDEFWDDIKISVEYLKALK